ncbi:hypothetical protein [Siphonobacter sp. SORGH_AS_1065]|uniref:hypothetical protein n=1 Tax=Siphonobacter sp. SORGH_AS_1065 TaxID=3041795 RepID=UPI0027844F36|nr:hypothetical protein [Siphonobacter sp. SORGH_AS_1065]MDQ1090236.1 hypothetical protein [Siphonobacter sp. SORGH_AS_1065]
MKNLYTLFIILTTSSFAACGQSKQVIPTQKSEVQNLQIINKMDTNKLTNETVKKAFDALQSGDKLTFYSFFTKDPIFTDDGRTLNFKSFFDNAFNHKEKFLSIDKVENEGKSIYGDFFAGQWGTFKVFFKFHQNAEGQFDRLDIGQGK